METNINVDVKDLKNIEDVEQISAKQFKFLSPFRCVFFSQSAGGKTHLIAKILENADKLIVPTPDKFIWVYSRYFTELHQKLKLDIEFYDDLDYEQLIGRIEKDSGQHKFLVILDDALELGSKIDSIFTRDCNNLGFRYMD